MNTVNRYFFNDMIFFYMFGAIIEKIFYKKENTYMRIENRYHHESIISNRLTCVVSDVILS